MKVKANICIAFVGIVTVVNGIAINVGVGVAITGRGGVAETCVTDASYCVKVSNGGFMTGMSLFISIDCGNSVDVLDAGLAGCL